MATNKITPRMVSALQDMRAGGEVRSGFSFSWPSWHARPSNQIPQGCPSCQVLTGLHIRGLVTAERIAIEGLSDTHLTKINQAGLTALDAAEQKLRNPAPTGFRRHEFSYIRKSPSGLHRPMRTHITISARTEQEGRSRLARKFANQPWFAEDIRLEGVYGR